MHLNLKYSKQIIEFESNFDYDLKQNVKIVVIFSTKCFI